MPMCWDCGAILWGDRANHHCRPVDYANRQELLATRGSEEDR